MCCAVCAQIESQEAATWSTNEAPRSDLSHSHRDLQGTRTNNAPTGESIASLPDGWRRLYRFERRGFAVNVVTDNLVQEIQMPHTREERQSSLRALEWLNFFLADVQTGLGPFLAAYLAASGWSPV